MDNGWTKFFIDGTQEHGTDIDISRGLASWRQGRNENLDKVTLYHNQFSIEISRQGIGSFWQSDDYIARFLDGQQMIKRRIQCQVQESDLLLYDECLHGASLKLRLMNTVDQFHASRNGLRSIALGAINKWLTAEIDLVNNIVYWYIAEGRK